MKHFLIAASINRKFLHANKHIKRTFNHQIPRIIKHKVIEPMRHDFNRDVLKPLNLGSGTAPHKKIYDDEMSGSGMRKNLKPLKFKF